MIEKNKYSMFINAGIIAGPFFIILALLQAFGREGFDMVRHPASLLSLGSWGWIQIANFVLTGLFLIACGIGIRRTYKSGVGKKWLPRLFFIMGIGLIMGGIFPADPSLGFPPGAPEGSPDTLSWHAILHGFAPIIASLAHAGILLVIAQWFYKNNQSLLMTVTIVITITMFVLSSMPNATADWEKGIVNFLPLWCGVALGYFYTSFILLKFKAKLFSTSDIRTPN